MLVVRDVCKLESYDEKPKNSGKIPPTRSRPTTTLPKKQTNKRSKLTPAVVEEHSDGPSGFDRLPDEMLEKIFSYLSLPELGRARRVCKRWFTVTRSPAFWKRVDVKLPNFCAGYKFIDSLPSCVTQLRMEFVKRRKIFPFGTATQNFPRLTGKLSERCPNLEVLIFKNITLQHASKDKASITTLLNSFPENLRVLILERCCFEFRAPAVEGTPSTSNIEVLDFVHSHNIGRSAALSIASVLPNLKRFGASGTMLEDYPDDRFCDLVSKLEVLDLECSRVSFYIFQSIVHFGRHLKALYVCFTDVTNADLTFDDKDALPNLEVVCVRGTLVTSTGIKSLTKNCKSLKKVYGGTVERALLYSQNPLPKTIKRFIVEHCGHFADTDHYFGSYNLDTLRLKLPFSI